MTDNGSDFKSKAFRDLLSKLDIEHQIAPPGVGSAKGLVERTFGEFASDHKVVFSGRGLITKNYNSKHHEEAFLTLDEYNKYVLLAIMKHNELAKSSYPMMDFDILDKEIIKSPIRLWNYFTNEKKLAPPKVLNKKDFYFSLMNPIKATLNRQGVTYKKLNYSLGDDVSLHELQQNVKSKQLDFRMDPRDVSRIYYLKDGELLHLNLNKGRTSNALFFGMSLIEYEETQKQIKDLDRLGEQYNQEIKVRSTMITDAITENAQEEKRKNSFSKNDTKNIRKYRKEEKLERAYENRIETKLSPPAISEPEPRLSETSIAQNVPLTHSEFLEDFDEL